MITLIKKMKEISINIPDESSELVIELVERLGGTINKKERINKGVAKINNNSLKEVSQSNKIINKEKMDHTYICRKLKNFDIDTKKIRE